MSAEIDIRLPNLTEGDEQEQLRQIRSYLYQLARQLQYALGSGGKGAQTPGGTEGLTYPAMKGMLLRSGEVVTRAGFESWKAERDAYIRTGLEPAASGGELRRGMELGCRVETAGAAVLQPYIRCLPEKMEFRDPAGVPVLELKEDGLHFGGFGWHQTGDHLTLRG